MKMKYAIAINDYDLELIPACPKLFDRDEDLLIFDTAQDRTACESALSTLNIDCDDIDLFILSTCPESPLFSDYGFVSEKGIPYLYSHLTALFTFPDGIDVNEGNGQAAYMQMAEHIIGETKDGERVFFIVDRQLQLLIEGIAQAYGVKIEWN